MRIFYVILIFVISSNVYAQVNSSGHNKISRTRTLKNKKANRADTYTTTSHTTDTSTVVGQSETITEKYLKGDSGIGATIDTSKSGSTGSKSPFVSGIHAVQNGGEKFNSVNRNKLNNIQNVNNINNANNVNNVNNPNVTATPVAAPNDTVYNVNTITDNGILTNSGAIDKSGNAQFGQTNWGNSRSTIGESQWTVPPPITASFMKEFPNAANTTWSRNNKDSSIYSARYKSGDTWITSNYNASGQRLDMRSEVPLVLLPKAVNAYISKMPANLEVVNVTRWQVLEKADVYEIRTRAGKIIYVNSDGVEVNY